MSNYFSRPWTERSFVFPLTFSPGSYEFSIKLNQASSKSVVLTFPCNTPPTPPVISGPTTGIPNSNYAYTLTSIDPQNDQIRYGIDWNMDGTADNWLPTEVSYINSGTSQSSNHNWSSTGVKTFQALAQDVSGLNSNWRNYTVTISNIPPTTCQDSNANNFGQPLPCTYDGGVCGTRNTTYPIGTTGYPGGSTYCAVGTPTSTPGFPPPGGSVSWNCVATGGSSPLCTASVEAQTFNVVVNAVIRAGGSIKSQDGAIDCGSTCSSEYPEGSSVILKATPSSSYWQFSGWSGDCSGTAPECTLSGIVAEKNVTANFILRQFRYIEF